MSSADRRGASSVSIPLTDRPGPSSRRSSSQRPGVSLDSPGLSSSSADDRAPLSDQRQPERGARHAHDRHRRVVYYQNSFVTLEYDSPPRGSFRSMFTDSGRFAEDSSRVAHCRRPDLKQSTSYVDDRKAADAGKRSAEDMPVGPGPGEARVAQQPTSSYPPRITAIEPGAMMSIPIIQEPDDVCPNPSPSRAQPRSALHKAKALKESALVRKLTTLLQDNRGQSAETRAKLRAMNRAQEAANPILKRTLNVIFITTGMALFLAVIVVIIYTSVVPEESELVRTRRSVSSPERFY